MFIAKDGRTITDRTEIAAQFQRDMNLGLPLTATVRHVFVGGDTAQIGADCSNDGKGPDGEDVHLGDSASEIVRRGADGPGATSSTKIKGRQCGSPLDTRAPRFRYSLSHGMTRTEVRSRNANVISGVCYLMDLGTRAVCVYCMNLAAPLHHRDQFESEGYGEYLSLCAREG